MLVETIIDGCQSFLHDNGTLFTRAELLRWVNDGYRDILTQSHAVRRPFQLDIPGRTAWSASHDWESGVAKGTFRRFTHTSQNFRCQPSFQWEIEMLAGISPTTSLNALTHLWERAYSTATDQHFRFGLAKSHERPTQVYWDDKRLTPISTKELDMTETSWWNQVGEPFYVTEGTGREQSIEVYEVVTDYNQVWDLQSDESLRGCPRQFTSDASRTYGTSSDTYTWDYGYSVSGDSGLVSGFGYRITTTQDETNGVFVLYAWEKEQLDGDTPSTTASTIATIPDYVDWTYLGVGLVRGVSSADRQYVACAYDSGQSLLGIARDFKGSASALTVWEIIVPIRSLTESDTPTLVPPQLHKFLKFYALAKAFGRAGESYRPDIAQHFSQLYQLGVGLLAALGTPSLLDRVFARDQVQQASVKAPPRVRLPSTFQRTVW